MSADAMDHEIRESEPDEWLPVGDPVASATAEVPRGAVATLLRGGGWNTGAQLAPLAVNLVMTPYVIHGLGVARFGLYILATSISDFLGTFDGGFYSSSQRYFAVYGGANDRRSTSRLVATLTVAVLILGAIMAAILNFAAPLLVFLFRVPDPLRAEGAFMIRTLGFVIALELLRGVFAALLNSRQRFAVSSLTTVGQYGVYTVGVILTIVNGWGLRGIALTLLVQTVSSTLVLAAAASPYIDVSQLRFLPRRETTDFLKYASKAQVAGLSDLINLQSDSLIIGGFLNVQSVAFYSSGRNFANQMRSLPWNAISPAASMLGQTFGHRGQAAVLEQFGKLQRWWVQACSGWVAVAAAAAYFGVTQWLGHGFRLAGSVAVILLIGYMFRLWAGMMTVYCQTVGHPELEARYGVVSVAVNLALTLALVVPFGVIGVVVATATGQLIGSLYLLFIVRKKLGADVPSFLTDVPWPASAMAAAVTVALELLAWPVLNEGPLGLLEAGILAIPGLVVFAAVLLGPVNAWQLLLRRVAPSRIAYASRHRHD